eukprot:s447_g4.t2
MGDFPISVLTLGKQKCVLMVGENEQVESLKMKLEQVYGIEMKNQKVWYQGKNGSCDDLKPGRRLKDFAWAKPARIVLGKQLPPKPKGPPPKYRTVNVLPPVPKFPPPTQDGDRQGREVPSSPRPPNRPVPKRDTHGSDDGRRLTPSGKAAPLAPKGPPSTCSTATTSVGTASCGPPSISHAKSWSPAPISGGATPKAPESFSDMATSRTKRAATPGAPAVNVSVLNQNAGRREPKGTRTPMIFAMRNIVISLLVPLVSGLSGSCLPDAIPSANRQNLEGYYAVKGTSTSTKLTCDKRPKGSSAEAAAPRSTNAAASRLVLAALRAPRGPEAIARIAPVGVKLYGKLGDIQCLERPGSALHFRILDIGVLSRYFQGQFLRQQRQMWHDLVTHTVGHFQLFSRVVVSISSLWIWPSKVTAKATVLFATTASFGMLVMAMQNLGLVGMMTVEWPISLQGLFSICQLLLLDIDSYGFSCIAGQSEPVRYLLSALIFPVGVSWLALCFGVSKLFPKKRQWEGPKVCSTMGAFLQVGFSTMSATSLAPMMCYQHPNGQRSIMKYPGVICGSSEHDVMLVIAWLLLVVFVFGFVSLCAFAAYMVPWPHGVLTNVRRQKLQLFSAKVPRWSAKRKDHLVACARFLVFRFRLDSWWFGVPLLVRGPLINLPVVLATDFPPIQVVIIAMVLTTSMAPWTRDGDY